MPKSKVNPDRKSKRVTTKQTKKSKSMSQSQVRNRPVWDAQEKLEITGLEFEKLYNFFGGITEASEALHSVVTRNILSGKIRFEFERADENGQFVPLSEEESQPYQKEVDTAIKAAKAAQEQTTPKPSLQIVE